VSDEPINLSARRFDRAHVPNQTGPRTALDKALADIESGEETPEHVIVIFGTTRKDDGASALRYYNAGDYGSHAQNGLLATCLHKFIYD
jgi:hypothetical protein